MNEQLVWGKWVRYPFIECEEVESATEQTGDIRMMYTFMIYKDGRIVGRYHRQCGTEVEAQALGKYWAAGHDGTYIYCQGW